MDWAVLNHKKAWEAEEYLLVPLREEDILLIKQWRNDQIDVLRQKNPLTDEDQKKYYHTVLCPLFGAKRPEQILFSLLLNGRCIGYGGLVHIDWSKGQAEVSFLVDSERARDARAYGRDFRVFLSVIKGIAFDELHLAKLVTETYDSRPIYISILEENGFVVERWEKHSREIKGRFVDSIFQYCIS